MNDENDTPKEEKTTQYDKDGKEIFIKDPIYDIMGDAELESATNHLMSMIDEANEAEDKKETPKL